MSRLILTIVALLTIVRLSLEVSLPTDSYYMAGVVEFRTAYGLTSAQRLSDNLNGYLEILNSTKAQNIDIIVFPESTLNSNDEATFLPNPSFMLVIPCDVEKEYPDFLVQLSCAAKNQAKYIVINLSEKELCSSVPADNRPCATNGLNIFNTNVVFDRSGAIISRYRKVHLFGENKNTTLIPELGWFDTDFGVRFGHFICFDILFYTPAQELAVSHRITDFIFPSMWFSQLPFLTAVQVHQAWSYANDVNLLAAGASNPMIGSTGSGIYNGRRGILVANMTQNIGQRKLYIAKVPKYHSQRFFEKRSLSVSNPNAARLSEPNIFLKRDYLQSYESLQVNLTKGNNLSQELCFNQTSFCCHFHLRWQPFSAIKNSSYYQYRLGVYKGLRYEIADESNQLMNCAIFSCIGDDIMDCGKVFAIDTDVIFENITITATFPKVKEYLIMPNSLTSDLMPVPVTNFEWHETEQINLHHIRFMLNTTTANVLTFSIYGNYFDTDLTDLPNNKNDLGDNDGAVIIAVSKISLLIFCLINLIF